MMSIQTSAKFYTGANSGYSVNHVKLCLGPRLTLYYHYSDVIAIEDRNEGGFGTVLVNNVWGSSGVGKCLNAIDGGGKEARRKRLHPDEFNAILIKVFKRHDLYD